MRALSCVLLASSLLVGGTALAPAQDVPSPEIGRAQDAPPPGAPTLPNGPEAASPAEPGSPAIAPPALPPALPVPTDPARPAASRAERLDTLFAELKREADPDKAGVIAARIQAEWLDSGSATIDLLMGRAAQAASRKDMAAALDLLDQTIVLAPDYAEGWNRRATLQYGADRFDLSIADVEATLKREPRHFGALAGLATMYEELGRRREALATYERALAIYPALKAAQDSVIKLADELAGERA
ncbi:hypothetical protein [Aureimonas pseudogalii]|uniref:Tetratricopeptide (TPR) repeat protein n=1 Tax=Aureimonas pseudogalii TaxID=1744844 RepID=A0A7W6EF15_9HYPH|nr:hypothetical protein [Aureimonas pseudogalii]MBB3997470.1 tetratricopeptide (TPR) repeat protein [Aureimonas pseudogalii]